MKQQRLPQNDLPSISVLTLGRGRDAHLRNVIRGLARQTTPPVELIIGCMQDDAYTELPEAPFPIRQLHIPGADLPLSRARNSVARAARGQVLIFLDIDCIPAPDVCCTYGRLAKSGAGLLMGEVMYLPSGAAKGDWRIKAFDDVAERHSDRPGPPTGPIARCADYRCFWSLNFAIHRSDWDQSGGFDERFTGYGGEDTDFGRQLDDRGIPISWVRGARVYHQYHQHCMPPIHHIPSILRNTEIFAKKWGHRTMEHWLSGFRMMGLVKEINGVLMQIREPDAADFALCRQNEDMPYANTARVLRQLRQQASVAAE